MMLEGNFPQVQVGKEPKQRTQNYHTHINPTKTTAEKEDAKDSIVTHQRTIIAAEKEDATDSTAHKATTIFHVTTSTATEVDNADSMAKPPVPNQRRDETCKEEASKTNTTTTMSWLTTSTYENGNRKTTNSRVQ